MNKSTNKLLEVVLAELAKDVLLTIKNIRDAAEKTGLLDRQWYLNWLDALNILSIDQDRIWLVISIGVIKLSH